MTQHKEKTSGGNPRLTTEPNTSKETILNKSTATADTDTTKLVTTLRAQADLLLQEADDILRRHYETQGREVLLAKRNTFHDRTTDPYAHHYAIRFESGRRGDHTLAEAMTDRRDRDREPGDFWGNPEFRFEHIGIGQLISERFNENGDRVSMFALLPEVAH